ncbi:MAG: tetratricopeptide repeat protein, partial [Deltaproteobacteria bacterium]|nr:tetratricopeptide repeat protein [Deltaproteobacteria bacterium]
SDIFVLRNDLDEAEKLLLQSLDIGKQIQYIDGVAFSTVKLGQISQLIGDKETARSRYREGLAIFERMGMPEAKLVCEAIASLDPPLTKRWSWLENVVRSVNRWLHWHVANRARDAGLAYVRKQTPKRDAVNWLEETAKKLKDGESAGSPWLEVAALCDALSALIKEESIPPVPAAYASHFSAVQSEIGKLKT